MTPLQLCWRSSPLITRTRSTIGSTCTHAGADHRLSFEQHGHSDRRTLSEQQRLRLRKHDYLFDGCQAAARVKDNASLCAQILDLQTRQTAVEERLA